MVDRKRARTVAIAVVACLAAAAFVVFGSGGRDHQARADSAAVAGDTVSVQGMGTVQGVPDRMMATFGVHATRGSVQDALDAVARDAQRVVSALRHAGVSNGDMRTTDLELYPHYDNRGGRDGYDASETVTGTFHDLATAGRHISQTVAAAGNAATVNGLSFDLSSDTKLLGQARSAAFADAKARAQQYAELSGRSLGAVQHVTETVVSAGPQPQFYKGVDAAAAGASAAVPVQAGQQPVTVVVTVVWRLS
ncbi:MAG TPA: SIMPL domain-containing protein [Mycobacteriales bacterium]|nr:SIMPL domain-containing protein [Mycobacteriales bacterium]